MKAFAPSKLLDMFKTAFFLAVVAITLQVIRRARCARNEDDCVCGRHLQVMLMAVLPETPPVDFQSLLGKPRDREQGVVLLSHQEPLALLLRGFLNQSEVTQLVMTAAQQCAN